MARIDSLLAVMSLRLRRERYRRRGDAVLVRAPAASVVRPLLELKRIRKVALWADISSHATDGLEGRTGELEVGPVELCMDVPAKGGRSASRHRQFPSEARFTAPPALRVSVYRDLNSNRVRNPSRCSFEPDRNHVIACRVSEMATRASSGVKVREGS